MNSRVIKQVDVRRRVYHLLGQMTKVEIVKHFPMGGIPRSTIYSLSNVVKMVYYLKKKQEQVVHLK